MLVSRVAKWFSYTHTHTHTHTHILFFPILSIIGYYKILSVIAYTVTAGPCGLHMCVLSHFSLVCLWPYGLQPARLLCPWDSTGKNTWFAISSSRGSSWPRMEPSSSALAGGFITTSITWEAYFIYSSVYILIPNFWFISLSPLLLSPLVTISLFSMSVSLFLFCK